MYSVLVMTLVTNPAGTLYILQFTHSDNYNFTVCTCTNSEWT